MRDPCTCTADGEGCPACRASGVRRTAHRQVRPGHGGERTRKDRLADALRHEAAAMRATLRYLRRAGITGEAAQRFLARQRQALQRERTAKIEASRSEEPEQVELFPPQSITSSAEIGCPGCGRFRRITSLPVKTCCGHVFFTREGRYV